MTNHFAITDGAIGPQPWMQHRAVATTTTPSVARRYGVTGGAAKNDLLQTVEATWTNNSPLPQRVYGLVTQGGSQVNLQARSRGYLQQNHGYSLDANPLTLVEASRFGGGADIGQGGILGIGTGYAIHRVYGHSHTMPLMPHLTGLVTVAPGQKITTRVTVRFISEVWEATAIDRGDSNTESAILAGELRLDLFAQPQIGPPPPRRTPQVVTTVTGQETAKPVTITRPPQVQQGDVLVAIVANQMGVGDDITAPAGWSTLFTVNDGIGGFGDTHMRVFTRTATPSEPPSYTFTTSFLAEEIVHLMVLRGAAPPEGDIETTGWAAATTQRTYHPKTDIHDTPSISRNGALLIGASYFAEALTENRTIHQAGPAGMTQTCNQANRTNSLAVAYLVDPPNPTLERRFVPDHKPVFAGRSICASILIPGAQVI